MPINNQTFIDSSLYCEKRDVQTDKFLWDNNSSQTFSYFDEKAVQTKPEEFIHCE